MNFPLADRSVAVVHEWYGATGGSEAVFRQIAAAVPHAERFVLWRDRDVADGFTMRESWLARTPLRAVKSLALPAMPFAWRTLGRGPFDVVVSSSHAFAHTVRFGPCPHTRYLSYVHSPARYLWSPALDGRGSSRLLAGPRRVLQVVDVEMSRHVHSYAANSQEVRGRIQRYWRRDARVIHPPVDVEYFSTPPTPEQHQPRDYLLAVGRWVRYKNFDLVIAIAEASGRPLVIAGSGPEHARLVAAAARTSVAVTFEERPTRSRLRELYWGARALLYPVHEDFGIIPVEAQACGTPVVGLRRGGLTETVIDGATGFLVDSTDPGDYCLALDRLDELDSMTIRDQAHRFDRNAFQAGLQAWFADVVE